MTKGIRTSEFWLTAITTILSWLVALDIPIHISNQTVQDIATVAAIVVPAAYAALRTALKLGQPPPSTLLPTTVATLSPPIAQPAPVPLPTFSVAGPTPPATVAKA